MPVANVRSKWSAGNLIFHESVAGNGAMVEFGEDASGLDVKFFGATADKYLQWDESADTLINTGGSQYGVSGTGVDVTFYGDTADNYMQWDASVDSLLLIGTAAKFRLGTFASATAGSGSVLDATDSAAFRVYTDDGGAAIGSGTLARSGEFRNLLTYTDGNREQEAAGVVGKLVSVAGTNRHNMCGVMGSYETKTSLTVGGQAATTDTWCQAAVIGRVGGALITIDTNGVLAGVAAMSNVATALAGNSGVFAGFYVGKWASTETWSHGLYVQANAVDQAIQVGELSSDTAGSGVTVASSTPVAVEIHADDGDSALGSAVTARAIDGRFMNYASVAAETWGIQGKCKISTLARTANVAAGVVGSFESTGTCSLATGSGNTFVAGVMGRLGLAANMTLAAGTYACGVLSFYNTASASDPSGEYTVAFMATASDIAGTGDWDYGLYLEDITTGIDIDSCTTGIEFGGTYASYAINMQAATPNTDDDDLSLVRIGGYDTALELGQITANTFIHSIHIDSTLNPDQARWLVGSYNKITISGEDQAYTQAVPVMIRGDIGKPIASFYGVQSHVKFSGTGDCSSEVIALSAQTYGTAAVGTGYHWGVKSDLRAVNTPAGAGHTSAAFFGVTTVAASCGLYIESLAALYSGVYVHAAAATMTNVIEVGGATNTTYFLKFNAAAGCIVADTGDPGAAGGGGTAAATHKIKCQVGSTTFYLAGWADF